MKYDTQKSASAYERHQIILELVERFESVRVADLAEHLHVSESTVRTDLETLDEQGQLVRVRGGALAMLPVRSAAPLPKGLVREVAARLREVVVEAPVAERQVILADALGTGVDIVASREIAAASAGGE